MNNPPLYLEDRGSGFPVVFLHAFPMDGSMWASAAEAIVNGGYRAVTLDFPGFGNSKGRIEAISDTASEVASVLNTLKLDRFVVCGLSMGGYVALELIKRSGRAIAAAVLCDTTADADSPEKQADRHSAIEEIKAGGSADFLDALAGALVSPATAKHNPELADKIRARFDSATENGIIAAQKAMAYRVSTFETLAALDLPVLLIFGQDDPMHVAGERMNEELAKSELVTIENAGHFSNLEAPQEFNKALVGFLNRQNLEI